MTYGDFVADVLTIDGATVDVMRLGIVTDPMITSSMSGLSNPTHVITNVYFFRSLEC
jgi:hypothetical protein